MSRPSGEEPPEKKPTRLALGVEGGFSGGVEKVCDTMFFIDGIFKMAAMLIIYNRWHWTVHHVYSICSNVYWYVAAMYMYSGPY